jgi:hypothetical protein
MADRACAEATAALEDPDAGRAQLVEQTSLPRGEQQTESARTCADDDRP